ncbi:hypothetical protein VD659_15115 [Herbiconiux sp. 11R-BC]|uniref:hypothetical protein n=1 Tax=Herbiconiux sp. 11R-BC TaxID=3111637 RepID=UPI003C00422E
MADQNTLWTRELLQRRRALHARIDGVARSHPAAAARARLALYSTTHRFDRRLIDVAELADDLALLDLELDELTAAAAA